MWSQKYYSYVLKIVTIVTFQPVMQNPSTIWYSEHNQKTILCKCYTQMSLRAGTEPEISLYEGPRAITLYARQTIKINMHNIVNTLELKKKYSTK